MMGGSGYNDAAGPGGKPDKVFQHNSKISTTIVIEGFTLKSQQGKLWPSFGDCLACMCLNFNGDKAGRAQPHFDSMLFTLDHIKQIQPDCPH